MAQAGPIGFLGADLLDVDARATTAELRRRGFQLVERHYEDFFPIALVPPRCLLCAAVCVRSLAAATTHPCENRCRSPRWNFC